MTAALTPFWELRLVYISVQLTVPASRLEYSSKVHLFIQIKCFFDITDILNHFKLWLGRGNKMIPNYEEIGPRMRLEYGLEYGGKSPTRIFCGLCISWKSYCDSNDNNCHCQKGLTHYGFVRLGVYFEIFIIFDRKQRLCWKRNDHCERFEQLSPLLDTRLVWQLGCQMF